MKLTMLKCCITEFYTENNVTQSQIKINTYEPSIKSYYDYLNFESKMIQFIKDKLDLLSRGGLI